MISLLTSTSSGCLAFNGYPSNSGGIQSQADPSVVGEYGDEMAKEEAGKADSAGQCVVGKLYNGNPA